MSFVSEPITPVGYTAAAVLGEPGLPEAFEWRDRKHVIVEKVGNWKSYNNCLFNPKETYLRKHWYEVKTDTGHRLVLYFDRQPRTQSQRKSRWVIYEELNG